MVQETVTCRYERDLGTEGKHTSASEAVVLSQGQFQPPVQGHIAMLEDIVCVLQWGKGSHWARAAAKYRTMWRTAPIDEEKPSAKYQ